MVKNIIFDIGYVLLGYRWKEMLRDYGLNEADTEVVYQIMADDPEGVWSAYDRANATRDDVIRVFSNKYPEHSEVITWVFTHPEYMHVPRPQVWKKVHALKEKGYGIYLLSNYPKDLFEVHMEYADFMKDIDGMVISYMLHIGKPEREIYETLCEKYDLIPEECVFFDDREDNIAGANAYGIQGIRVTDEEKFMKDMDVFLR